MVASRTTEKQTLVEEGTEFTGTLKAKCKVVVRGSIDGDLEAPAVDVADSGSVTGNVKAGSVRSAGVLAGSVEADEIALAGEVKSDTVIRAKSLEIKLASDRGRLEVTFGDCIVEVGDMPGAETTDDVEAGGKGSGNGKAAEGMTAVPASKTAPISTAAASLEDEDEDDDEDDEAAEEAPADQPSATRH